MRTFFDAFGNEITEGQDFAAPGSQPNEFTLLPGSEWDRGPEALKQYGITWVDDPPLTPFQEYELEANRLKALAFDQMQESRQFTFGGKTLTFDAQDIAELAMLKAMYDLDSDPNQEDTIWFANGEALTLTPATLPSVIESVKTAKRNLQAVFDFQANVLDGSSEPETYQYQGETTEPVPTRLIGGINIDVNAQGVPEGDEYFRLLHNGDVVVSLTGLPTEQTLASIIFTPGDSLEADYFCGGNGHNFEFFNLTLSKP